MARLAINLLGPIQVFLNGEPASGFDSDKVRGLLAYLAVEADRPHRRERLAGLLWPEYPERSARVSLRRALANLRQVIGDRAADPPFLLVSRQTIQFNQHSDYELDASAFVSLVAGERGGGSDVAQLKAAADLYGGGFLEGFSLSDSEVIADSQRAMLLMEWRRSPVYYFPQADVRMDLLVESDRTRRRPSIGTASYWHVEVAGRRAENAAWIYPEPRPEAPDLRGYIAFSWHKLDAWFEEDEQVFVHAKDPYVRVDTLHSSRHIKVVVEGQVVAESRRPVLLFETGLVTRYYLPLIDVRMDLLEPSDTRTACPYKGEASYYHLRLDDQVYKDLVWYYPFPNQEVAKIQNLVSFYNEKVDIYVDGELQERPRRPFV